MVAAWRTRAERATDANQIERLLDRAFGGERHLRRSELFRQGRNPIADLCRVAEAQDAAGAPRLLGVVRGWEVLAGTDTGGGKVPLLLAGPLAVEPSLRGQGIGKTLLAEHLAAGRRTGWRGAVLIGEPEYYRAFGFRPAVEYGLFLPWSGAASLRSETMRFLALELRLGGLEGVTGAVSPAPSTKSPRKADRAHRAHREHNKAHKTHRAHKPN